MLKGAPRRDFVTLRRAPGLRLKPGRNLAPHDVRALAPAIADVQGADGASPSIPRKPPLPGCFPAHTAPERVPCGCPAAAGSRPGAPLAAGSTAQGELRASVPPGKTRARGGRLHSRASSHAGSFVPATGVPSLPVAPRGGQGCLKQGRRPVHRPCTCGWGSRGEGVRSSSRASSHMGARPLCGS